jgi:plasmid stabilization system protein ParE
MVKWTDHALTQLRHIHDYIAQDSPLNESVMQ